ncbi:SDR family NAD(P)-dependent oxidoreductase [Ktedonobacter racemifer]|jgi:NAD(P)-dependent dehydrogenase (short-subunit alcohol dehydrogenase family)|uniref:Short-chain dehydrogenase/reductase SDR n=1 Tax=Ktedonobacter racemifer DSM 44963 TaxID=485913 RepID=D6U5K3_KTERA|nr:glucose 1-dehydrogenase [Ktedonobacter racemifer]EFH80264.1 short-chain dehydrogenase/reductase SDR [Ktedonobacter racemifer DSM 44963]
MEQSVKGQVAIVTGAGQGIGRAIALRLSQDGMKVVLADLQGDAVARVADEIRANGGEAIALSLNILHAEDRQRMIESALSTFHRLDALVNNAGVQRIALPLDVNEEHWDHIMDVNAKATYFCCQLALKYMIEQKNSGRIVNIASIAGKMASTTYHPIYNASKAAVLAITKTLAIYAAKYGVRVNAVCPGMIETSMQDMVDHEIARITGQAPAEIHVERNARIPLGYMGDGADVAAIVSFLVGPDSHYMTGQALNADGGVLTY